MIARVLAVILLQHVVCCQKQIYTRQIKSDYTDNGGFIKTSNVNNAKIPSAIKRNRVTVKNDETLPTRTRSGLKRLVLGPEDKAADADSEVKDLKLTVQSLQADLVVSKATQSVMQDSLKSLNATLEAAMSTIRSLQGKLSFVEEKQAKSLGSLFYRWGNDMCPGLANLVYKGILGGRSSNDTGSGVDTVCLQGNPGWDPIPETDDDLILPRPQILGTTINAHDATNVFNIDANKETLACCLCRIDNPTSIMVPGTDSCFPGWRLEYHGFLMAAARDSHGTDFICVDSQPSLLRLADGHDADHVLYVVTVKCGALPCPPYIEGKELSCVVCSQ